MKATDIETVQEKLQALATQRKVLAAFEKAEGDTVPAFAQAQSCAFQRSVTVQLLPVPKELAVSAAQREVDKLVGELAMLGVEV